MRLDELKGQKIAILGLGREGIAARDALHNAYPDQSCVLVNEKPLANFQQLARHADDRLVTASLDEAGLASFDVLILSPGISRYRAEIKSAASTGTRLTSGTQIWFSENPHIFSICISGTKGKSTTASLIAFLLEAAGKSVQLAGNIGTPLLNCLGTTPEYQVIELSSFQLAGLEFSPGIGVLLSFFPEHLAWHGGEERYLADKLNLVTSARTAVINGSDATLAAATQPLAGRLLFDSHDVYHADDSGIYFRDVMLIASPELPLRGVHNAANICAALTVIEHLGLDREQALQALPAFQSLPHRLQLLPENNNILYVNDSIATTPFAALAALKALPGRPVTQLLGGFEREVDWSNYINHVGSHPPAALVCMGQNGPRVYADLQKAGVTPSRGLFLCDQLPDAFRQARQVSPEGGLILLSPGAASFPEFTDFEHRGRVFTALAREEDGER